MRILRGLALAVVVSGTSSAQRASCVLSFREAFAAIEGLGATAAAHGKPIERLRRLVTELLQAELPAIGPRDGTRTVVQAHAALDVLLVSGTQQTVDVVATIHKQFVTAERCELNVQISVLTLPGKLAKAHGIAPRIASPMTEAAAGTLIKQAIAAKGTLRNLPELEIEPFVPFSIEAPGEDGKRDPKAAPLVSGETLLLGADEALFALQFGAQDRGASKEPRPVFRLKAGSGVMLMDAPAKAATEDEEVIVLWVRFVGLTKREPAKQDDEPKPRGK